MSKRWWSAWKQRSPREPADSAQVACERAAALFQAGDIAAAREGLQQACLRWPQDVAPWLALSALHLHQGDASGALAAGASAPERVQDDPAFINLLALARLMSGQADAALAGFTRAATQDSGFADAQANAGWLNFVHGQVTASTPFIRRWLSLILPKADGALFGTPPLTKRRLAGVTVVCIDCVYHELAVHALRRSMAQCEFDAAYFFTDREIAVDGVSTVLIEPLRSSQEYSNFALHKLREHIRTPYVLIVQYDGFVLNGAAWNDEFFDFDYIGAKFYHKDGFVVGNGGFSFRSKRLLDALGDEPFIRHDARESLLPEDMIICMAFRERLEREYGIRFAPGEVADRFAVEATMAAPETFGFHNVVQAAYLADRDFVADSQPGSSVMPIKLRADTPLGPFAIEAPVTLGGGADVDRLQKTAKYYSDQLQ